MPTNGRSIHVRSQSLERPLRPGDFVEVLPFAEIAVTLDARGELDGLPFMAEMLPFCGGRFEVWKRADKTCDEGAGSEIRRLENTVHLNDLRCDGRAHGGCDAGCLLFWHEKWLRRVGSNGLGRGPNDSPPSLDGRSEQAVALDIFRATRSVAGPEDFRGDLFSCQATEIRRFSQPLPWWDLRQYLRDLYTRNITFIEFLRGIVIGVFNKVQQIRGGSAFRTLTGAKTNTPKGDLNLSPGDLVEIKSRDEIIATLDRRGRNGGLTFAPVMVHYCGKRARVARRVTRIIDPASRRMVVLRGISVILDGVVCTGEMRRFCPRMIYTYWRDVWLTKISSAHSTGMRTDEQEPNSLSGYEECSRSASTFRPSRPTDKPVHA